MVVLSYIRKQAEQTRRSKSVRHTPLWSLYHVLLLLGVPVLNFHSDGLLPRSENERTLPCRSDVVLVFQHSIKAHEWDWQAPFTSLLTEGSSVISGFNTKVKSCRWWVQQRFLLHHKKFKILFFLAIVYVSAFIHVCRYTCFMTCM